MAHALRMLKSRRCRIEMDKRHAERDKVEATKKRIDFGSQIRNYVLHPYKLIKGLRTGIEHTDVQNILAGNLNEYIKAFLMYSFKSILSGLSLPTPVIRTLL